MTSQMRRTILVPLAGAVVALPLGAAAAAFQNGSFETPGVGANGFVDITSVAQAPIGWMPGGTLGSAALFYEGNGTFGTPSEDGLNMIGFGGNGQTGATLAQTFDTVAGTNYTVSFFVTAQQIGNGPQSYSAQALNGLTILGSNSASIPEALNWVAHSFSFVATGTSSTVRFTDTSNGSNALNINWALDNVMVSGVPEPGPLSLLATGLVVLAMRSRARLKA